jgi:hypothetical protein
MAMKLFDNTARDHEGPARYAEPSFSYLNRSARPAVKRIRQVLEAWFGQYPESEQAELRGRFRSNDDRQHNSAFFELLLHEVLAAMGCFVEIHPSPLDSGTTRHPDFLVRPRAGSCFYVEAILATAESAEESAARARKNEVYDALNRLDSPNFFVGLDIAGAPSTPPSAKRIRAFLKKRLDKLDPDEIGAHWKSGQIKAVPKWPYEHDGWSITFYPIPKSPKLRGQSGVRPIGMVSPEARFVDSSTPIRNAIVEKAGRYGDLKLPYIIAVNALDEAPVDKIDIMDALFGNEQYTVAFGKTGMVSEPEISRAPNGAWTSEARPRYTRVSAVLLTLGLFPWTVGSARTYLVHNPWAQRPYSSPLTRLPQGIPEDGQIRWQEGDSLYEILGLPPQWPDLSPGN